MTRREVIVKALAGVITWAVAASVIGVSERHMRRMKERYEQFGWTVCRTFARDDFGHVA